MTNKTSRRGLLAASAALAAGSAANVIAIASSRAGGRPETASVDAELIELGRRFDRLAARQDLLDEQLARVCQDPDLRQLECAADRAKAPPPSLRGGLGVSLVERDTGPHLVWVGDRWKVAPDPAIPLAAEARRNAVQAARARRAELGVDLLEERVDENLAVLDAVQRTIALAEAKSLAGVAVKARSVAFTCRHWFEESDDDADWDHLLARSVIQAVLALAGAQAAV